MCGDPLQPMPTLVRHFSEVRYERFMKDLFSIKLNLTPHITIPKLTGTKNALRKIEIKFVLTSIQIN